MPTRQRLLSLRPSADPQLTPKPPAAINGSFPSPQRQSSHWKPMRDRATYSLVILAAIIMVRNLYLIFMVLPDEASQGMIYRLLYFHVPAWWTAFLAVTLSAIFSVLYLIKNNPIYDAIAASVTEVAVAFLFMGITLGSIWGRIIWGIWWTWDARLTSALICVLLYSGYLLLRRSTEEPTQRARLSAVFSLFAFIDVPIVWFSIRWWRTQHPQPMDLPPEMWRALLWNWLGLVLLTSALTLLRLDQEQADRRAQSLRRLAEISLGEVHG
jgi:heme exporter protein C